MKNILICIDGSPYSIKAASTGIALARGFKANVSFIHVIDKRIIDSVGGASVELLAKMKEDAKILLYKISEMFSYQNVLTFIEEGKPAVKIIEMAKSLESLIIILGTRGRSKLANSIMGSVAEGVVKDSKIPVLIVPFKSIDKK